jgi:hypothetical protein
MWWIAHAGWTESLSWDPDFIYVPMVGAALLLGAYLLVVPEARDVLLVAWFVALLFGAGMLGLRGVMYLGTIMTVIYVGTVALHARQGGTIEPAKEAIRIGLLVGALVRLAAFFGALMMLLFYFGNWSVEHGVINGDFAYMLVFLAVAAFGAGRSLGLDQYIENYEVRGQPLLERYPRLEYVLG